MTCSSAFLPIYMRSIATSRLNTISEGGKLTRARWGGALRVWQVSHDRKISWSSFRVDSSAWFDLARLNNSLRFRIEGWLKCLWSLTSSRFVKGTYLVLQHKYKCLNFLSRGIEQLNKGDCNSFVTLLATRYSRSNTSNPSSKGTSAGTTSNFMLENERTDDWMVLNLPLWSRRVPKAIQNLRSQTESPKYRWYSAYWRNRSCRDSKMYREGKDFTCT